MHFSKAVMKQRGVPNNILSIPGEFVHSHRCTLLKTTEFSCHFKVYN